MRLDEFEKEFAYIHITIYKKRKKENVYTTILMSDFLTTAMLLLSVENKITILSLMKKTEEIKRSGGSGRIQYSPVIISKRFNKVEVNIFLIN